jgi:MFS family permease
MKNHRIEKTVLLTIYGLVITSSGILSPVLPLYLTSLSITPQELGLLFSVQMIAVAIGELTWGRVIDKVGVNVALFTGTFLTAGLASLYLVIQSLPLFFLLFFGLGFVRAAIIITGRWYVAVNSPPSERASSMGLVTGIGSGARSVSNILGGAIVDLWGFTTALQSAIVGPTLGGILYLLTFHRLRASRAEQADSVPSEEDKRPLSIREVIFSIVGIQGLVAALIFTGLSIFITYMPLLSTQVMGSDATGAGTLLSIQGFVTLFVVVPLGRLADRKGKRLFMIIGLLGTATAFLGMAFSSSYTMLVIFTILFSLSFAIFVPAALGTLSETVPNHQQGLAIGMYGVFEDAGMVAGSGIGGIVWEQLGHVATFLCGSLASIIGAFLSIRILRTRVEKYKQSDGP